MTRLAFAAVLLLLAPLAFAGSVAGTVTDAESHAAIADADVVISGKSLPQPLRTMTDENGDYEITDVPPGVYTISVGAAGYRLMLRGNVTVTEYDTTRVNLVLMAKK